MEGDYMSSTFSHTVKIGRLTKDAELKYTNGGMPITKFTIVTDATVKKDNEWVDVPSYWLVELWGKRGESLIQYLTKGKLISVSGEERIDKREWEGKQYQDVVIKAETIVLLTSGSAIPKPELTAKEMAGYLSTPKPSKPEFDDDFPSF